VNNYKALALNWQARLLNLGGARILHIALQILTAILKRDIKEMTTDRKETKHTRYDAKRKNVPQLPSTRINDESMVNVMEELYSLCDPDSKVDTKLKVILDASQFALKNKALFTEFRSKLLSDEK
jgi:hypothetical protein